MRVIGVPLDHQGIGFSCRPHIGPVLWLSSILYVTDPDIPETYGVILLSEPYSLKPRPYVPVENEIEIAVLVELPSSSRIYPCSPELHLTYGSVKKSLAGFSCCLSLPNGQSNRSFVNFISYISYTVNRI